MGTSATAPVTAPEDALRRAREAVARVDPGAGLPAQGILGPVTPFGGVRACGPGRAGGRAGTEVLLGTTCAAVPRGR